MGDRKLERVSMTDRRFSVCGDLLHGFSLKFVFGPEMTKDVKPGSWLEIWEFTDGKLRFGFGPQKNIVFVTKEAAVGVQKELGTVGIVTEIVE
jgi:hypothetical protein